MADRDPAEQQLDRDDAAGQDPDPDSAEQDAGLEDSIDKAVANQSVVSPADYPEKNGDNPL